MSKCSRSIDGTHMLSWSGEMPCTRAYRCIYCGEVVSEDDIKPKKAVCEIINSTNSWILKVDGMSLYFSGSDVADYFKELHERLGYEVKVKDTWKLEGDYAG